MKTNVVVAKVASANKTNTPKYSHLGKQIFGFWVMLGRLGVHENSIFYMVFSGNEKESIDDFTYWIYNCLAIKHTQLFVPKLLSKDEKRLIHDLEELSGIWPFQYKKIFRLYKKTKNLFRNTDYRDDML